jgi:hypothetical protein
LATERYSKDNLPLSEDLLSSTPRNESFVLPKTPVAPKARLVQGRECFRYL